MSKEYKIKKETVEKWLHVLYDISEADTLDNAISISKMIATDSAEIEILNTIAVLFRAECSGEIDPPIAMRKLYANIVASHAEAEKTA